MEKELSQQEFLERWIAKFLQRSRARAQAGVKNENKTDLDFPEGKETDLKPAIEPVTGSGHGSEMNVFEIPSS